MPRRNPYGCVFCPTYLLAFFFFAGAFFLAWAGAFLARGFRSAFASTFGAGVRAAGASTPATRISTWLVPLRNRAPPPPSPPPDPLPSLPSLPTPAQPPHR